MIITQVHRDERDLLLHLAVQTGLFTPQDAEVLLGGVLDAFAQGSLPDRHVAVACRESPESPPVGWSYFAPDQHAEGVWNLWWIGVDPQHHGTGAAHSLLSYVEREAASFGARILIIETSDQELLARARSFYTKAGYSERGRIPDFYGPGEAKVVFSRSLMGAA